MSIRITVRSADLHERTKKATGQVFAYEQNAFAWLVDRAGKAEEFPTKITLTLWVNKDGTLERPAYPPGDYTLAASSFHVGDYGRLDCSPRLVAVQSAAKS